VNIKEPRICRVAPIVDNMATTMQSTGAVELLVAPDELVVRRQEAKSEGRDSQQDSASRKTTSPANSSPLALSSPVAARPELVTKGLIAAPFPDSDEEEDFTNGLTGLTHQLKQFARSEVHPAVSLKVARGRQLLAESGILEDLKQMRQVHRPRPVSAQAQKTRGPQHVARPATAKSHNREKPASSRLPVHVERKRKISPLYNESWQSTHAQLSRFTNKSMQSLSRPLAHRIPAKKQGGISSAPELDDSGHAFGPRKPDIRPASAPPDGVRLDMDVLRRFSESEQGTIPTPGVSSNIVSPSLLNSHQSFAAAGLSSLDMLTAKEFANIPIQKLIPTLFSEDVVQKPHLGQLWKASQAMVENKQAKSMQGAMRKLTQDWTCRRGQWNTRSWSTFGAESKTDSLWFGKKGKGIQALAKDPATQPPVDFELACIMKKLGKNLRYKMWTALGIRSAEQILTMHNKDFELHGFCEFDRKLLRREAAKIAAQGDRPTRIRTRLVKAISTKFSGDASLFVQNLKGLFQATGGPGNRMLAQHMFNSLHEAQIIDADLLRESAYLQTALQIQNQSRPQLSPLGSPLPIYSSHIHEYEGSEAYASVSRKASSPLPAHESFSGTNEDELSLEDCLRMFWLVEDPPGSGAYTFQVPPVPNIDHEIKIMSKMSQDFNVTPRSHAGTFISAMSPNVTSKSLDHDTHAHDPVIPTPLNSVKTSYFRILEDYLNDGLKGESDTNQGAQWLDMSKLCIFVESCTALRNQGRPSISLRGTGQRYSNLALEVVQAIEQLQLEKDLLFVDNNIMDHKSLVSAASRRGAKAWAEKRASEIKQGDGSWPRYPRFGAFEVWAFLPDVAEPTCIFSKFAEKRFPTKNEVISRLADVLKMEMKEIAPFCEYVAPPKKPEVCPNCEMGILREARCTWCGAMKHERKNARIFRSRN
jgi:hypothetical protein